MNSILYYFIGFFLVLLGFLTKSVLDLRKRLAIQKERIKRISDNYTNSMNTIVEHNKNHENNISETINKIEKDLENEKQNIEKSDIEHLDDFFTKRGY